MSFAGVRGVAGGVLDVRSGIDDAAFQLDPGVAALMAPMVAFMVFGVALDLKWEHFARMLRKPRGAGVGLAGQLLVLPALAFLSGMVLTNAGSVALGLYVTAVVRGNAATSVTMTAVGTLACVVATPLIFGFWASMNPETSAFLRDTVVDPKMAGLMFMAGMAIPISGGMLVNARRPELAQRIRPWIRRLAGALFVIVVGIVFAAYIEPVLEYARQALIPVAVTLLAAAGVTSAFARAARVSKEDHRAVVLEVAGQNVAPRAGDGGHVLPGSRRRCGGGRGVGVHAGALLSRDGRGLAPRELRSVMASARGTGRAVEREMRWAERWRHCRLTHLPAS